MSTEKSSSPKKRATKDKKPATHPPVASMVNAAIKSLGEKKGSSLSAIKKYVEANYKVDMVRTNPFIRRYLKSAVAKKTLIQLKGSYKLNKPEKATKPKTTPKKKRTSKPAGEKKEKKVTKAKKVKKTAEKKPKKAKSPKKPKAKKTKKPGKKAAKK